MKRVEAAASKGVLAAITSFVIYLSGIINEAVIVLIFFMVLDFLTGIMRGSITKTWNSTLGLSGIFKKFCYLVVIGATAGIEYMVMVVGQEPKGLLLLSVTSFFVVNEGLSILENCAQMGVPIPSFLYNALEKLNRDPEGKEQQLERDPILEKIDKQKLIKQNQLLEQELKKEEKVGGGE